MFQERYRQAMLRIAKKLAKPETLETSKKFYELSKKKPDVPRGEITLFIEMIKAAERFNSEIIHRNVINYISLFLDPKKAAEIHDLYKRHSLAC
jgi:hypothetical protein